jgi:hypothetical protein
MNRISRINHSSVLGFESVWQYGTAEGGPNPHDAWERDGVAPQCAIPGLDWNPGPDAKYGRIRFQGQADFVQAHVGSSYGWVLKLTQQGRVQPR